MIFIPTTARNLASYQRTIFYENPAIKYVILNFGGLLLVDNKEDKAWTASMQKAYSEVTSLEVLNTKLLAHFEDDALRLQVKTIDSYYISIYNKFDLDNAKMLDKIRSSLNTFLGKETDFYLYENGNSFALLPNFLNKKFAVAYLIEKHKPLLTLGAGDNASDLPFMNVADFKIIPQQVSISLD